MEAVGLLSVLLGFAKSLFSWRWRIRVSAEEARNPATREFGFAQNSLKVEVANRGRNTIEIRDVRVMFARKYGFPPRDEPTSQANPELPARLCPGTSETWHFPAETIAVTLQNLSPRSFPRRHTRMLRPRVITSVGSTHRATRIRFSRDINAHW